MLEDFVNNLLRKWVTFVERFPLYVLLFIGLLTAFASQYTSQHFSINSDLDRLIKPTKVIPWYQQDRDYRASFPQYQQKTLIVVSGESAEATFLAAEKLYQQMHASKKFADVFAPEFEDFSQQHALYGAPSEGVRYVSDSVSAALPKMAPVYQQPDIVNFMQMMQATFDESADMEVLTPENRHQLEVLVRGLESLEKHKTAPDLAMVKRLLPQDTGDLSYHFISVKDHEDYTIDMPYKVTMQKIHDAIKAAHLDNNIQVRVTGEVPLENDQLVEAMDGVQLAGAISTVLILILLVVGIGYGRHSLILNTGMFLMLSVGIIWTTYLSLLAVGSFSTLSIIFLVMFFGLGVEFAIHYILCVEHFIYDVPLSPDESPCVRAAIDKGIPLILSALSAIIGFLSFLPTSYVGLAELGIVSAIGMAMALITTLTFLPAWLKLLGVTERKYEQRRLTGIGEKFGHFFSQKLSFAPFTVMVVIVILACSALYYASDIRFNYSHLAMRNANTEAMTTLSELQHKGMVTDYSIAVMVDPKADVEALKQKLLALPSVEKVELPADKIPLFQDLKQQIMLPVAAQLNALGKVGKADQVNIDASQAAVNAFAADIANKKSVFLDEDLLLVNRLEQVMNRLAAHPELYSVMQKAIGVGITADMMMLRSWFNAKPFTLETLPDDIKSWFVDKNDRILINVIPKLDMSKIAEMDQFIAEVQSVSPNVAGRTIVEWGVGNMVIDAFIQAASITFIAIFILLWLNFRHISTVILVFTPLVLTTIFMFAIMKMIGLSLNMANILVVPMIYGLGVDMGIHVVDEYHKCRNVEDLVVSYTTRSIVLGALTTVSSFVAMSFSPDKGSASIGILLSISMLLLLAVTYIALPALLAIFKSKEVDLIID